jgi:hypothetical protein
MSDRAETAEGVALALAHQIMSMETSIVGSEGKPKATRKHLLDLYAECLLATKGRRDTSDH